ncbi:MAG: exodeoxyribonuclease III [Anaerolineae bacterium]
MPGGVFKVATYNANSIRVRLDLILDWLDREQPDVLCVQETKVQDQDFPEGPILDAGYHVVYRGQKAQAGVAILSLEEPEGVARGLGDGKSTSSELRSALGESDEARLIRAVIRGIPVINTYVPQGRSPDSEHFQYKLAWFARLCALFDHHYSPVEPLLWMGDFNVAPKPIDVYDPEGKANHVDFHPEARAALGQVMDWGFVDVFRRHHPDEAGQYTYYDYRAKDPIERGIGWRVDHIWATETLAEKSTNAWIDVDARRAERPSDHTLLIAEFAIGG